MGQDGTFGTWCQLDPKHCRSFWPASQPPAKDAEVGTDRLNAIERRLRKFLPGPYYSADERGFVNPLDDLDYLLNIAHGYPADALSTSTEPVPAEDGAKKENSDG